MKKILNEMEIKSIDAMSLGKVYAIIGGIIGVILGVFIFLAALASAVALPGATAALSIGVALVVTITVILFYALISFIGGLLVAVLYNYTAKKVGGVKIKYKTKQSK